MTSATQDKYITEESVIYGQGITTISGTQYGMEVYGTGASVDVMEYRPSTPVHSFSNIVVNKEAVDGYVGLYNLESVTFTATLISDSSESQVTYNRVIIPAEITVEKEVHLNDTEIALVGIIPLLVVIGLIIGVVAIFARRAEIF